MPPIRDELHDCAGLARVSSRPRKHRRQPGWDDWLAALARDEAASTRLQSPAVDALDRRRAVPQFRALWPRCKARSGDRRAGGACGAGLDARGGAGRDPARPAGRAGARHRRARWLRRSGSSRARSRPRWPRSRPKASPCAGASRRAPPTTNGASAGCWRASTATRSSGCARRSSRSPRATSCASCSAGSAWRPMRAWRGRTRSTWWSAQLEGFEAPAGAWETEILPARVEEYEPAWLDDHCLAGRVAWARLRPRTGATERQRAQRRAGAHDADHAAGAPPCAALGVAVADAGWRAAERPRRRRSPTTSASTARRSSTSWSRARGLLRTQVEEALAELVALGLVDLRQLRRPARAARARPTAAGRSHRAAAPPHRDVRHGGCRPLGARAPRPAAAAAAAEARSDRACRAHAAAPLRRRVLAPARARGRLAAALARPAARLSPARSARRDPRRPLRRRLLRRAVRAARSGRRAARGAPQAGRRTRWSRSPAPIRSTSSAS